MKSIFFNIALCMFCLLGAISTMANGFSYVYIQGDKTVPFYVKFEDQMLPRYGKNYSIIPQLVPGSINIQVLFQQNMYPPQKFTIVVPENGFRGFLLLQKNGVFSLYDIHQQFYLQPGNKAEDDKIAPHNNNDAYVYTSATPSFAETKAPVQQPATVANGGTTLKFLPNVELNNEHRPQQVQEPVVEGKNIGYNTQVTQQPIQVQQADLDVDAGDKVVTNSDCPSAINDAELEDLYNKVLDKSEKMKLKFLLTKVTDCYTSNQARILAETLNNDPERYTFLKKIYPRITDQYNFVMLESLLSTQEWKSYFKLILPK